MVLNWSTTPPSGEKRYDNAIGSCDPVTRNPLPAFERSGDVKRVRVARTSNEAILRILLREAFACHARLEMVFRNGSRRPIATWLDKGSMRSLIQATRPGSDARLELVFPAS